MSKAEILAELPKLSAKERGEVLEMLWRLEEASGPNPSEKAILREAQAAYDADRDDGSPWSEVHERLRKRS